MDECLIGILYIELSEHGTKKKKQTTDTRMKDKDANTLWGACVSSLYLHINSVNKWGINIIHDF